MPAIIAFLGYDPLPRPANLAERVVQYRRSRGWSQKRLAAELDVDPTTLARWERGEKTPIAEHGMRVERLISPG
jgi:ribosome-binding protein aMBF1 (putative translation factor)